MQNQINAQPAMWAQALKEAVQTAISMYSGDSSGIQHAGTQQIQGSGMGGGGGYPYSAGAGEGGAGFDPYSTSFQDTSGGGMSDFSAGGGMDNTGGMGGGGDFGGFA